MANLIKMTSLDDLSHLFIQCATSLNEGVDTIINSIDAKEGDQLINDLDMAEEDLNSHKPFKLYDLTDTLTMLCPGSNNTITVNTRSTEPPKEQQDEQEKLDVYYQEQKVNRKKKRPDYKPRSASGTYKVFTVLVQMNLILIERELPESLMKL